MAFDLNEVTMNIYDPMPDVPSDIATEVVMDIPVPVNDKWNVPTRGGNVLTYFTRGIRVIWRTLNLDTLLNYMLPLALVGMFVLLVINAKSRKKAPACECEECHSGRMNQYRQEYEKLDESWAY